jgi:non-homologous end joining protein Ku
MRPYWKGYLKLALVSCPIALHAACSSAERIALRQINKATGNKKSLFPQINRPKERHVRIRLGPQPRSRVSAR